MLAIGGGSLADLVLGRRAAAGYDIIDIAMTGNKDGSRVWFDPAGVLVRPGQTIRWTNHDRGNAHTATAYHPANQDHPLRIPAGAEPWDSGYLLPEKSFETILTMPGVYDYFCTPHELAGMVGRIVIAATDGTAPNAVGRESVEGLEGGAFPPVERILREGRVRTG